MAGAGFRNDGVRRAVDLDIVLFSLERQGHWTFASTWVARGEPGFYLRLGPEAGLRLIRVLREGLWYRECLARLWAGRTRRHETASRTQVRVPGAHGEANAPCVRQLSDRGLARLQSQLDWIVAFSRFPKVKSDRGQFARERHPRELLAHPAREHAGIEIVE